MKHTNAFFGACLALALMSCASHSDNMPPRFRLSAASEVPRPDFALTDARVRSSIEFRFQHHKILRQRPIAVSVSDGIVSLNGAVNAPTERALASRVAMDTLGTQAINNHLTLQGAQKEEIHESENTPDLFTLVKRLLALSKALREPQIFVAVRESTIVLTGEVKDKSTRELARELTENIVGVRTVENHIAVRTSPQGFKGGA